MNRGEARPKRFSTREAIRISVRIPRYGRASGKNRLNDDFLPLYLETLSVYSSIKASLDHLSSNSLREIFLRPSAGSAIHAYFELIRYRTTK